MEPFDRPPRPSRMASDAGELGMEPSDPGAQHIRARRDADSGKRPKAKRRNILWRWRRVFFLIGLLGMAAMAAGVAMIAQVELPALEALQQTTFICDSLVPENECNSHTAMATISPDEARENVRLDDVPEVVQDAVVAAEDRDFWRHQGLDPVGIGRALYHDLRAGGASQGGSTITQQFVKNRFLTHEQTLTRKLNEAVLAIKVEQEMSKEQILEGYLNSIYLGRNAYGIQAASEAYFGKPIAQVNLAEAAYLAGLIRAPELADCERQLEEAIRRRQTVLDAMLEMEWASQDEVNLAGEAPLSVEAGACRQRQDFRQIRTSDAAAAKGGAYITAYAREEARRILREQGYTEEEIDRGGWRIYTTVDPNLQAAAYDAVYGVLTDPANDPDGALVALNADGQIKAWVGGRDFNALNVDLARQGRQVGSTFKPIALAAAVQQGASLTETQVPAPGTITIQPPEGSQCDPWEVSNYDEEDAETGSLNLIDATAHSSNTAYGRLMAELTPETVWEMAGQLGMDAEPESMCLPTVLGTENSTALEMAEVYSVFANNGMHSQPEIVNRIERVGQGGDRQMVYSWRLNQEQAISASDASKVTHALQQVIADGTGHDADIGMPAAGKTGTTQSNRDAWFCGFVPGLTTSVWMGYPTPDEPLFDEDTGQPLLDDNGEQLVGLRSMRNVHGVASVTGGSLPAQIWQRFMASATEYLQLRQGTFPEVTDDQLSEGEALIDEPPPTSSTLPPVDTQPTGPGGTGPDFTPPSGPTTSEPDDTTTTSTEDTTTSTLWPPIGGTSSTIDTG
jgi:membrane peptidoglycan carboxypeptidase